ncbi:MAG: SHOCT domain-containing protein [Desulfatiglandaceae bacterium]|jgi:uncharacterized membrane protein
MKKLIVVLVFLIFLFSGCSIGSGKTEMKNPTLGQQLIELKEAKDKGAISEGEYQALKEKLKKSY